MTKKTYLGDGLYASDDGFQICLSAEDGTGIPRNEVFLEPEVLQNFFHFIEETKHLSIRVSPRSFPPDETI